MYYRAFGFRIDSEIALSMLPECTNTGESDIRVERATGLAEKDQEGFVEVRGDGSILYQVSNVGTFSVTGGNLICADLLASTDDRLAALYILGRCMGAVFQQRGLLALHGSCICRDEETVLICGDSGAGKSTLASEFLSHGWSLMTDDVALLIDKGGCYFVRSSYPAQKLWKDAISYYDRDDGALLPLLQETRRDKYHVKLGDSFFDGEMKLSNVILLSVGPELVFTELRGMEKISGIISNIYLQRALADEEQNGAAIRTAVLLSRQLRMFSCIRNNDMHSTNYFYQRITEQVFGSPEPELKENTT